MLRNKLVRSDGSIIDSSVIISCEFTEEVNSSTNLSVGDVTSSEITVEILSTDAIQQDDVITYYVIEDGVETKIGVFNAEKPTVATRTSMRFSAYGRFLNIKYTDFSLYTVFNCVVRKNVILLDVHGVQKFYSKLRCRCITYCQISSAIDFLCKFT